MGLSARKTKQRIGADPRNLTWSDDSSKFGAKYLKSLGWTSGTGLGASGEGRVCNLKIHQKLDLLGIGGNRRAPGGDEAGWKGGREFEGLLARLNQARNGDADGNDSAPIAIEEARIVTVVGQHTAGVTKAESEDGRDFKKKRKRPTMDNDDENNAKETKRKRKEEKRLKKDKKKADKAVKKLKAAKNDSSESLKSAEPYMDTSKSHASATSTNSKPISLFRAHRARHLASKRMAAVSTTSMNEILGISSSMAASDSSSTPFPKEDSSFNTPNTDDRVVQDTNDTPYERPTLGSFSSFGGGLGFHGSKIETLRKPYETTDLLLKSEKSMADYFSEKMLLKTKKTKVAESAILDDSHLPIDPLRKSKSSINDRR